MASKSKKKPFQEWDTEAVRRMADGQWPSILYQIAGIDPDIAIPGQHFPCPFPGCPGGPGTDRFRVFNDYAEKGGVICNQCFNKKNADGFAVIMHAKKIGFIPAVALVAEWLGIEPINSNGKHKAAKQEVDPAEKLEWLDWNEGLAAMWCLRKTPITTQALRIVGARQARYRDQFTVLALPVWGERLMSAEAVGWVLYNITGAALPSYFKTKDGGWDFTMEKILTTYGSSKPGLIGPVEQLEAAEAIWKLEGPSDVLAFYSLPDVPENVVALTNKAGAKEMPTDWMVDAIAGKTVYVLHDQDRAGEDGAAGYSDKAGRWHQGWCERFAMKSLASYQVKLPYELTEDGGKDLRDYLKELKGDE